MASFLKGIAVGYLGRDAELRHTPQGTAVASFSVAANHRRKDKSGEYQEHTTWVNVTVFGSRAETLSQHLTKGKLVFVEGRLSLREYQDRDGNTRQSLDLLADDIQMLSKVEDRAAGATSGGGTTNSNPISDDEIPF
jgi:single-strand DNA-binding protein